MMVLSTDFKEAQPEAGRPGLCPGVRWAPSELGLSCSHPDQGEASAGVCFSAGAAEAGQAAHFLLPSWS